MESMLLRLFFPPPLLIKAMSVEKVGLSEFRGKHLQYSKFLNIDEKKSNKKQIQVSSRTGMLIAYTPSFLTGAVSFGLFPNEDLRFLFVKSTLTFHFFKRILEHKDSQKPAVDLKYPGIVLFLIGIIGNFYHHRLLSKLRSNNDKEYKVPKGGLFDLEERQLKINAIFIVDGDGNVNVDSLPGDGRSWLVKNCNGS
ncbi:steroid 5-alpha-reductase DET2-like [Populus alba x Populus x berolinensis]|nr:steroid 5-alpha-reductase DET2-like [Populus alba x Populus x berolinensis]